MEIEKVITNHEQLSLSGFNNFVLNILLIVIVQEVFGMIMLLHQI